MLILLASSLGALGKGAISAGVGASLIGAGMIFVLVFPLLGIRIAGARAPAGHVSGESDEY